MVKKIVISNFKRKITAKEQKKIINFARSITSNRESIQSLEYEPPSKGIREIKFEIDSIEHKNLFCFLFLFLSILQKIEVVYPEGEWHTIKCGSYLFNIFEEGQSKSVEF